MHVDCSRRIVVPLAARLPEVTRRVVRPEVPHSLPDGTWVQMDDVDLHEVFLLRIPMLKSCPYFLRGRFEGVFRSANVAELSWLGT